LPGDTRSSQYRSTIRPKLSWGIAALAAGAEAGAGPAPQAASPRHTNPSETT
jgi:hypothetical protein